MTTMFDPWSISPAELTSLPFDLDMNQQMQVLIADQMRRKREPILKSGFAVLDAVATCARYRLTIPKWLADEFINRFNSVAEHESASWDNPRAFGRPYPKGTQIARLRKDTRSGPIVLFHVNRLLAETDTRIDEALFEKVVVAMNSPFQTSECRRIYYEELKRHPDELLAALFPNIAARKRKA